MIIHRSLKLCGVLMLISAITHVAQVFIYHHTTVLFGVTLFGVAYCVIGLLLFNNQRLGVWAGATVPAIGGIAGLYRLFIYQPNPFSACNVLIDVVVVSICTYWLLHRRRDLKDAGLPASHPAKRMDP